MRQNFSYHTHTFYSDGAKSPEEMILKAIDLGLDSIGISDHAPIKEDPTHWNMKEEDLLQYFVDLKVLKEKYKDKIDVLLGLEIDYIPNIISAQSDYLQAKLFDYHIGSVHFVGNLDDGTLWDFEGTKTQIAKGLSEIFDNDVKKMVQQYYLLIREMIEISKPNIVGHLDRIKIINRIYDYFDEQADWYQYEIEETLNLIAAKGCIMEINTKGMYRKGDKEPYPSLWIIEKAKSKKIPMHIAADAHHPKYLIERFDDIFRLINIDISSIPS